MAVSVYPVDSSLVVVQYTHRINPSTLWTVKSSGTRDCLKSSSESTGHSCVKSGESSYTMSLWRAGVRKTATVCDKIRSCQDCRAFIRHIYDRSAAGTRGKRLNLCCPHRLPDLSAAVCKSEVTSQRGKRWNLSF